VSLTNRLDFEVRDYECDLQGIVNNARYIHYLEHARHHYLKGQNISFVSFHEQGKDLIVTEAQLKYHKSLYPGDNFFVETSLEKLSPIRFSFIQKILRSNTETDELVLEAQTIGVCLDRVSGKAVKLDFLN